MQRHAEIAGAGFAGLAAAIALRQAGWTVTVHERGEQIRAYGSALALSENGLRVLEMLDAYGDAVRGSFPLDNRETRDGAGRLISAYNWKTESSTLRMFMLLRSRVIEALAASAARAGVEILTSSEVAEIDESGAITLADGRRRPADLAIVADGARSKGRIRQGLLMSHTHYSDGSIRLLLPRPADWKKGTFVEYWSGRRRVMLAQCSEQHCYLGLIARKDDIPAIQVPITPAVWIESFPFLASLLDSIPEQERWSWDQYQRVRLRQWHCGRVAVLGDAAHAMSPNFGQGAALAMVSAVSLASATVEEPDLSGALEIWEARERPLVDRTQFLSGLYSSLMAWPQRLRDGALAAMGKSRWIMRQRTLAAYRTPPAEHLSSSRPPALSER